MMNILKTNKYFTGIAIIFLTFVMMGVTSIVEAYGECSQYGTFAMYESWSGSCKCMSGYVFGKDIFGETSCVSANSVCADKYGYNSRYDSLSGACECSHGYSFGEDSLGQTKCISDNQICQNQLGHNSRSTYGGSCECSYGYVIDGGKCVSGDSVCRSDHGYYSDYSSLSNKCECDDGYTFDEDDQCVEKKNSAYFNLLDIDDNDDRILVESQYNYQNYIIEYGVGCRDYALESYLGSKIVINMGTDFDVDLFDTVVLQNHDQTCSIMGVDHTSLDEFDNEEVFYAPPPTKKVVVPEAPKVYVETPVKTVPEYNGASTNDVVSNVEIDIDEASSSSSSSTVGNADTGAKSSIMKSPDNNSKKSRGFWGGLLGWIKSLFN